MNTSNDSKNTSDNLNILDNENITTTTLDEKNVDDIKTTNISSNKRNKNEIIDDNDVNNKKKMKTGKVTDNNEYDIFLKQEEGICCFCGFECNIMSQSCGRCARQYTMNMFGWNYNKIFIK